MLSGLVRPRAGQVLARRRRRDPRDAAAPGPRGLARTFQRLEVFSEPHRARAPRGRPPEPHRATSPSAWCSTASGSAGAARAGEDDAVDGILDAARPRRRLAIGAGRRPAARHRSPRRGRPGPRHRTRGCCCSTSRPRASTPTRPTALTACLRAVRAEQGIAIVLVEHNVEMVLGLADQITVLDFGQGDRRGHAGRGRGQRRGPGRLPRDRAMTPTGVRAARSRTSRSRYGGARALFGVDLGGRARPDGGRARRQRRGQELARRRDRRRGPGAGRGASGSTAHDVTRWPAHRRARAGVAYVPEGRGSSPPLRASTTSAPCCGARSRAAERADALAARRRDVPGARASAVARPRARCRAASSRCWRWPGCSPRRRAS